MTQTFFVKKTRVLLLASLCGGLGLRTASADETMWVAEYPYFIDTVDVQTGAGTAVGDAFPGTSDALSGIAFDSSECLFGISNFSLYRINNSDGEAVLVGAFGSFDRLNGLTGMTFSLFLKLTRVMERHFLLVRSGRFLI